MLRVSCITPSIREDGLEVVRRSLDKQTLPRGRWEWIVVSPFKYHQADKWVEDPPKLKNDFWVLNKAYNKAIRASGGELIVSWQDWIWAPTDALEKFLFWFDKKGDKWAVTGSGHQYQRLNEFLKPVIQVWDDPRRSGMKKHGEAHECFPVDWEINFASAPKKAFYDIGGFDEGLDSLGFGMDNVSVCERMDKLGYRFWIDHSIECRGVKHGRHKDWDKYHNMHGNYEKRKSVLLDKGDWPKLNYLS